MTNRLLNLLPDVTDTFRRFSVAALVAAVTFVVINAEIANGTGYQRASDWFLIGAAAFLGSGIGHLFSEGRRIGSARNVILALIGAAVAGGLTWFYSAFQTFEFFLFCGLWLLLMVAAYLRRDVKQGAIWLFNMKLHLSAVLAALVSVLFGVGLSAVVAGLDFLLGISLGSEAYQHIWYTATTLVGPLYGLSLMPRALDEEIDIADHKDTIVERALSIVVNYVLVPLVVVYAVILHTYAVKIIFNGALPKGEIGVIVSLFAAGGTATWLLAWPWREQGTRLLRLFMRGWFWLLPVPIVLLVMAIWRRVADYGVTPDRFGIALVAIWAVIVFAYLLWRRNRADMRVLVGSAAALLLITSVGPFGAYDVTGRDQLARLTAMMEKAGVISAGKFVKKADMQKDGTALEGAHSMVTVLTQVRALKHVKAWFGPDVKFESEDARFGSWGPSYEVAEKLGVAGAAAISVEQLSFSGSGVSDVKLAGAVRLIGPLNYPIPKPAVGVVVPNEIPGDVSGTVENKMFKLKVGAHEVSVPIADLMQKLKQFEINGGPYAKVAEVPLDDKITLLVQSAYGAMKPEPALGSLYMWIVVRE